MMQNGDLIYFRTTKKRTSRSNLKRLRQYHSDLSCREFQENCDYFDFTAYIIAKFSNSKLVYLGVSKSETN